METLKLGSSGPEVEAWKNFLVGQAFYWLDVDQNFDEETAQATRIYQDSKGLGKDGEVGPGTLKAAIADGFPDPDAATVPADDVLGPNWPQKPEFPPLDYMGRAKIFGTFAFQPAGITGNPEAIKITDGWDHKNIVTVDIPQLHTTKGGNGGKVSFHTKAATQLQGLWTAWESAGLLPLVLTFDGGWAARFVRGSTKYLSNHSYGTAFDINYKWNMLGAVPALVSKEGSVRKLVDLAHQHGFYWGGHFTRLDGMHFEVAKLIP